MGLAEIKVIVYPDTIIVRKRNSSPQCGVRVSLTRSLSEVSGYQRAVEENLVCTGGVSETTLLYRVFCVSENI